MTYREWFEITERDIQWKRSRLYRIFNLIGIF
jgi:hypothetical protein